MITLYYDSVHISLGCPKCEGMRKLSRISDICISNGSLRTALIYNTKAHTSDSWNV